MIVKYATPRDRNGNRYYLCVDYAEKKYAEEPAHWFCREDFIEVSKTDRRKLRDMVIDDGFTPVNYL